MVVKFVLLLSTLNVLALSFIYLLHLKLKKEGKKTFFLFLLLFSSDSYKYSFAFDVFIESIMATNQFHAMQCKSFCRIIFFNRSFYPFLVSSLDVVRFCIRLKLNSKLTILFRKELQDYSIVLTFYFHMNIHLKQLVFLLLYYENQSVK